MSKLTIAANAGFCPGVKQAIDHVLELSKKTGKTIYTLGPLIHNKEVIKSLEEKNIFSVENARDIKEENAILVIRAHGIPPELEKQIRALNIQVSDATCPLVKSVHRNIEKYRDMGYHTVILGDKDHAEVIGLKGYAKERGFVISSVEEARALPELEKVNFVSQTTQEEELFLACAEVIRAKSKELIISNTICNPTRMRQKETVEISSKSDLVIVVGGRHSANTNRLYEICSRLAKKAVLIEKPQELDLSLLDNAENIFITAGASTPNWLIEASAKKVREKIFPETFKLKLWNFFLNSGLYTGLAAGFFTMASAGFLKANEMPKKLIFSSAMFVLSLHVLNRAVGKNSQDPDDMKNLIFIKFASFSRLMALFFAIVGLILAYMTDFKIFFLMGIFWLFGLFYTYALSKYIQKIPASKDIILALGWTFACAIMPILNLGNGSIKNYYFFLIFSFFISLIRSILLSISQSHNDMLVGKENIYKNIGEKRIYPLLFILTILAGASFYFSPLFYGRKAISAIAFFAYQIYLINSFRKGLIPDKLNSEASIDLSFIILGLAAI